MAKTGLHVGGLYEDLYMTFIGLGGDPRACPFDAPGYRYTGPELQWLGERPAMASDLSCLHLLWSSRGALHVGRPSAGRECTSTILSEGPGESTTDATCSGYAAAVTTVSTKGRQPDSLSLPEA